MELKSLCLFVMGISTAYSYYVPSREVYTPGDYVIANRQYRSHRPQYVPNYNQHNNVRYQEPIVRYYNNDKYIWYPPGVKLVPRNLVNFDAGPPKVKGGDFLPKKTRRGKVLPITNDANQEASASSEKEVAESEEGDSDEDPDVPAGSVEERQDLDLGDALLGGDSESQINKPTQNENPSDDGVFSLDGLAQVASEFRKDQALTTTTPFDEEAFNTRMGVNQPINDTLHTPIIPTIRVTSH